MSLAPRTPADRFLEGTLLGTLLVHGVALLTMAGLLLPAMPGAGLATAALRLGYVQAHLLLWHVGWVPWHLSAVSDVVLSAALVRARWMPRWVTLPTLMVTVMAFAIEQVYETRWEVVGARLAASAPMHLSRREDALHYAAFEHAVYVPVCCVAAGLYAVMAMGWSWSLTYAATWNRWLTAVSCVAWPVLLVGSMSSLLPEALRLPLWVGNAANQVGFPLMMVWFGLVLEAVLRRTRPSETPERVPGPGLRGKVRGLLADSALVQYCVGFLPARR